MFKQFESMMWRVLQSSCIMNYYWMEILMATAYKRTKDRRRKGSKWIARWFNAELGEWKDKTGHTDKEATLELGRRLERESARRAEGVDDPMDDQRKRLIHDHLADFIEQVKAGNRTEAYVNQLESRITRVIQGTAVKRLHELDSTKINRFLSTLRIKGRKLSGITRNEYIGSLKSFTKWAVEDRRVQNDPLASLKRIERKAIKPTHPRRALSVDEVAKLLDATVRRPEHELLLIRRGKDKGKLKAKVRPETLARAKRIGQERRLGYLLAVWTGLRRSELAELAWGDIELDTMPARIQLRAEVTKSRRADTLLLHPQIAEELIAYKPEQVDPALPVLSTVPSMKVMKADLKFAGIDYGNQATGYADLHAMRKSLSTMMAAAGMSQRARQAHMRHTDPRLTEVTYMDETLLPIATELAKLPGIPNAVPDDELAEAIQFRATGTDDLDSDSTSANIQQTGCTSGHSEASDGTAAQAGWGEQGQDEQLSEPFDKQGFGTKGQRLSPSGNRRSKKAGEEIRTLDIHVGNVGDHPSCRLMKAD
ncbi:MAG: tyrosine-type recombinase/integrase [Planctomycetota bacterium]